MLKPVPETVLLALNVVKAPVLAVVAPTEALLIVPPEMAGLVSVLLVSVCEPVSVTTVESIAKVLLVSVRPVPFVYVCDPLNCAKVIAVVPKVIVPEVVMTYELPLLTVPFCVKK